VAARAARFAQFSPVINAGLCAVNGRYELLLATDGAARSAAPISALEKPSVLHVFNSFLTAEFTW